MRRVSIVSAWRIEDNPRVGCRPPKSPSPIRDETTENRKRSTGCSGTLCDLKNGVTCQHQQPERRELSFCPSQQRSSCPCLPETWRLSRSCRACHPCSCRILPAYRS